MRGATQPLAPVGLRSAEGDVRAFNTAPLRLALQLEAEQRVALERQKKMPVPPPPATENSKLCVIRIGGIGPTGPSFLLGSASSTVPENRSAVS